MTTDERKIKIKVPLSTLANADPFYHENIKYLLLGRAYTDRRPASQPGVVDATGMFRLFSNSDGVIMLAHQVEDNTYLAIGANTEVTMILSPSEAIRWIQRYRDGDNE